MANLVVIFLIIINKLLPIRINNDSKIKLSKYKINLSMKLKTPTRANFSRYGKLCDQTFYHDS